MKNSPLFLVLNLWPVSTGFCCLPVFIKLLQETMSGVNEATHQHIHPSSAGSYSVHTRGELHVYSRKHEVQCEACAEWDVSPS